MLKKFWIISLLWGSVSAQMLGAGTALAAGQLAARLADRDPEACVDAAADEEFDFFRVARTKPQLLPRLLTDTLRLAWDIGTEYADARCRDLMPICREMGLQVTRGANADSFFRQLRYAVAVRRVEMSRSKL